MASRRARTIADAYLTGYTLTHAIPETMDVMDWLEQMLWSHLVKLGYPVTRVEVSELIREYDRVGGLIL